jgi:hypothetical protein
MPELWRVQAAQAKMAHCVINSGYSIINGGLGRVNIMVKLHPMLMNQAKISSTHRTGCERQSSCIQFMIPRTNLVKEFCPQL